MIEDIKLAAAGSRQIDFHGTAGGVILSPDEVKEFMLQSLRQAGGAGRKKKKAAGRSGKRSAATTRQARARGKKR